MINEDILSDFGETEMLVEDTTLEDIALMSDTEEPVSMVENIPEQSIPIYSAEQNSDSKIKISEGNIVYHEKYGKGIVEQLIAYGNKTLCSIQFDNVGRRLLDPNLADLKQM
jgi:hypothetical protein